MPSEKARIEAELVGGAQVVGEANKIDAALGKVEKKSSLLQGAAKGVGGAFLGMASTALRAAGVMQTISLANAIEDVKKLDLATAKLGQTAGISGTQLKEGFNQAERKTLTSAVVMADLARQLGRVTYDGRFATESIAALGDEALAVGRDLGDELPLAAALRDMGVTAERLPAELGRIRDMAEQVGTAGGHLALKDQLAALQPLLSGVATESDQARARLEALVGVLGKGLKPEQAKQVGAAALQQIRARALDIERATGRRVIDDKGQIIDPTQSLADLKRLADKRFGNNQEAKRRALMADFGQELGLAILRTDFNEVDRVAKSSADKGKTAAEAEKFRKSKEGQRLAKRLEKEQMLRTGSEGLVEVEDAWTDALGPWGGIAAGFLVDRGLQWAGSLLGGGGGAAAGTEGLVGGITAAGAGTATAGLAAAATAAGQIYAVSQLGEDRDQMGAKWRSKQANTIGAELAQQAIAAGDVSAVWGKAQGEEQQAALMEALLKKVDQLNATMQGQAKAYADEMSRKTIKVAPAPDPNAPRGN